MRIRAMYAADNALRKLPPSKRKSLREVHVLPLMNDFFDWVRSANASAQGRNLATKALGYASNQEHELRRVLEDPRLPHGCGMGSKTRRHAVFSMCAFLLRR